MLGVALTVSENSKPQIILARNLQLPMTHLLHDKDIILPITGSCSASIKEEFTALGGTLPQQTVHIILLFFYQYLSQSPTSTAMKLNSILGLSALVSMAQAAPTEVEGAQLLRAVRFLTQTSKS